MAVASAAARMSVHAFKSGWLEKQTPGSFLGIHAWQKVFVTANECCLYYFRETDKITDVTTGTFRRVEVLKYWSAQILSTGISCLQLIASVSVCVIIDVPMSHCSNRSHRI